MKAKLLAAAKKAAQSDDAPLPDLDIVLSPRNQSAFSPTPPPHSSLTPAVTLSPATTKLDVPASKDTSFFGMRYEYVPIGILRGGRKDAEGEISVAVKSVAQQSLLSSTHRCVETLAVEQSAVPVLTTMSFIKLCGVFRPWNATSATPVTFDPVATTRLHSKQRLYAPGNVPESAVLNRQQVPPAAILRVLGTIDAPSASHCNCCVPPP